MAITVLIADENGVVRQGLKMSPESPEELTERETEVLKLLARGRANRHIATAPFVEAKTVKTHVWSMLGKLGLRSRTQAALHAVRTGLVSVDELGEESW